MKRHDIRLRKQEFGANRIKQYKDYKQLMRKHHRSNRSRNIWQSAVGVVLLIFITGAIYLKSSSKFNLNQVPEGLEIKQQKPIRQIIMFKDLVLNVVGAKATPKGGMEAYGDYIQRHLVYPAEALKENIQGIVNVQFLVKDDGSLSDFRIINSLGYGCDEEAIRIIKEGPSWEPGLREGSPLEGGMIVPVIFTIENN